MTMLFIAKPSASLFSGLASRRLQAVSMVLMLLVGSLAGAEENSSEAGFDRVWGHAKLYENPDSFVSLFALSGRLQMDSAWFSADADDLPPGAEDYYNDLLWRRFRFGFKMHFGRNSPGRFG